MPPGSNPKERDPRAYLEDLVRSSSDAIVAKTLDGIITGWNPAAERIFGFSAAEAIGRPMLDFIPDDRKAEEAEILARVARGERIEPFETMRLRKDGGLVDVSVSVSPILDGQGRVVGASKIARDISERKRFEARLLATIQELQDIKNALDEHSIVAITDPRGKITYVNDKFCSISKFSRDELIGQDHRIINSGYHSKEFFRNLWETIGAGRTWHGEICNRAKDGSIYWVDTTIFPRLGPTGKPAQYIAIRTDISKRKEDEITLQVYAEDLAEKNQELGAIIYTVSHDLRSPLVNVQGFGRQLARACEKIQAAFEGSKGKAVTLDDVRPQLEVTIPQALRFISAGVNKMEALLSGLLRYSRLGRETLTIARLDMNAILAEVVASTKFQIEAAGAELAVGLLPDCMGDAVQVSQVFSNLIDNAIKYRHPDRKPRISIQGRGREGQAVFTVTDNGLGIAPEHQAKVFEIFHRLNPDGPAGEGLGLSIAQRILTRQKGRLWIESDGQNGSTFYVSLPSPPPGVSTQRTA